MRVSGQQPNTVELQSQPWGAGVVTRQFLIGVTFKEIFQQIFQTAWLCLVVLDNFEEDKSINRKYIGIY